MYEGVLDHSHSKPSIGTVTNASKRPNFMNPTTLTEIDMGKSKNRAYYKGRGLFLDPNPFKPQVRSRIKLLKPTSLALKL